MTLVIYIKELLIHRYIFSTFNSPTFIYMHRVQYGPEFKFKIKETQ